MIRRAFRDSRRDAVGPHGDRPWVYFMIDAFFLVTQFFVLTFQLKSPDDLVLPNKMPPGEIHDTVFPVPTVETVAVSVSRATLQSQPLYSINGGEALNLAGVSDKFGEIAGTGSPDKYSVRVSYAGKVNFGDVMPIFNTCAKLRIKRCGLQVSREKIF